MRRFLRFNAVGALGIGVQLTALWVLVELWGVNYAVATPVAVGLAIVHNFLWHQRWTWSDRRMRGWATTHAFARFVGTNGAVSILGNLAVMLVLVSGAGLSPLLANPIAIAACGLINFAMVNMVVFTGTGVGCGKLPGHRPASLHG
ncbi:MAG TPA: GtrA family protein [Vicinamibacterales bacterium]|nr:GtrA family protein [Vicinamibacterales bacterium]